MAFFLAEIGDKTQLATAALVGQFGQLLPVVIGTHDRRFRGRSACSRSRASISSRPGLPTDAAHIGGLTPSFSAVTRLALKLPSGAF
jgi:hypothetical protein